MAERRTSHDPANRHRSPSLDNPQYHYESLDAALNAQPSSNSSRTRRRVTRTNSTGKVSTASTSSSCVDGDRDGGKRSKSSRNTLKKAHRRDSAYSDISVGSHDSHGEERRESAGFIPRLSQISEGRVSRATGGSEISSSSGSRSHRRRQYEEEPEDRKRSRRRHGSSRRHGVSPTRSTLSSVASAPSEAATYSSVSTGSGTTPTKTSYRGDSVEEHTYQPSHRRRKANRMSPTEVMEATEADVFQYMSEDPQEATFTVEEAHDTPPSTNAPGSTASDSDAEGEEEQSSDSEDSHTGETPTTSPASMRRSHTDTPEESRQGYRAPKVPLYASSFVHGHGDEDEEEEDSGEEESDVESEEDDNESDVVHDNTSQHQALERTAPPAAPPIPAPNDLHTERLRQRERELANHVLQSPQPQKDFKFSGAPSPHPCQPMPLYSPRAYTAATPATYDATAGYPAEWPPFPPPLPISYPTQSTLESPTAGHPLPLTVQPPAGAPNVPPQQHVPQLQQYPGQPPPHYQAHVPTTDVTRTTVAGYELLASKLSEPSRGSKSPRKDRSIVPMYRKFEYLNHRVLLHLQDEICELEEELRELDECIVQMSPKNETGHAYPASRRGDAEYGSELHYKRTELLGRIFQKLGQYNQAFTSFNSLLKDVDPASPQDIQAYRTWMDKRSPINQVEARFLERRHDLVAVSRKGSSASPSRGGAQNPSAAVWGPMLLAVPLLAFAIVPSLVGRLLVIVLVGGVEGWLVMTTAELRGLMSGREWIMGGLG